MLIRGPRDPLQRGPLDLQRRHLLTEDVAFRNQRIDRLAPPTLFVLGYGQGLFKVRGYPAASFSAPIDG